MTEASLTQRQADKACIDQTMSLFLEKMNTLCTVLTQPEDVTNPEDTNDTKVNAELMLCTMEVMNRIEDLTQGVTELLQSVKHGKVAEFHCTNYKEKVQYVLEKMMPMYVALTLSLYTSEGV